MVGEKFEIYYSEMARNAVTVYWSARFSRQQRKMYIFQTSPHKQSKVKAVSLSLETDYSVLITNVNKALFTAIKSFCIYHIRTDFVIPKSSEK